MTRRRLRISLAPSRSSSRSLAVVGAGVAWAGQLHPQASSNWAGWVVTAARAQRAARPPLHHRLGVVDPAGRHVHAGRADVRRVLGRARRLRDQLEGARADRHRGRLQLARHARSTTRGTSSCRGRSVTIHTIRDHARRRDPRERARQRRQRDGLAARRDDAAAPAFVKHRMMMRSRRPTPAPPTGSPRRRPTAIPTTAATPLRLTDFGRSPSRRASATSIGSAGRHRGAIDDPVFRRRTAMIVLRSNSFPGTAPNTVAFAQPSAARDRRPSFSVAYGPTEPDRPDGHDGHDTGNDGAHAARPAATRRQRLHRRAAGATRRDRRDPRRALARRDSAVGAVRDALRRTGARRPCIGATGPRHRPASDVAGRFRRGGGRLTLR